MRALDFSDGFSSASAPTSVPITFPDGLVGTPGLSWSSDTNTGWYRIGADNIGLTLGGSKIIDYAATLVAISSGARLTVANNTAGSSSSTGAFVVTGSIGVGETSYFGNGLNVTNIFNCGTTSQIFSTNEQLRMKRTGASGAATQSTGAAAFQLTEAHDTAITNTHRAILGNYSRTITTNTTDTGLQGVVWCRPDLTTGSATLTNNNATMGYATYTAAAPSFSGTGLAFTHFSHFYVEASTVNTGTNKYGMYIAAQTGATNNYGIYQAGTAKNVLSGATAVGGTTTNDSAAAGFVGELFEVTVSTATNYTSNNAWQDAGTMALTAGDWDIFFNVSSSLNGATCTFCRLWVSNTTAGGGSDNVRPKTEDSYPAPIGTVNSQGTVSFRLSLSGSATYYFKVLAAFSAGTPQFQCYGYARRVR